MAESKPRPKQKGFRLSETGLRLLGELSERKGVNETGVVELALRELAKVEGIPLDNSTGASRSSTDASAGA